MASKKRRFKRPTIERIIVDNVNTSDAARTMYYGLLEERTKALQLNETTGDDVPQPTWLDVAVLLQGQANLANLISELKSHLEDPAVAHVVEMKKSIDEMKQSIQDLRDEFNRHENHYDHRSSDPYY